MKTFRVWHKDGKPENIPGNSAEFTKEKTGLKIKIGKRTIAGAVALTEVLEPAIIEVNPPVDDDE